MSQPAPTPFNPARLDVRAFAQAGAQLSGNQPLLNYERLTHDLRGSQPDLTDKTVAWQLRGEAIAHPGSALQVWLHLSVQTLVPTTCQRCLAALIVPLEFHSRFRFVADEATALAQDEVCEEDVLVLTRQLDVQALIEDELLMAMPIVPKHGICPEPVKLTSSDDEFKAALTQKPHAFAALGSLKKTGAK